MASARGDELSGKDCSQMGFAPARDGGEHFHGNERAEFHWLRTAATTTSGDRFSIRARLITATSRPRRRAAGERQRGQFARELEWPARVTSELCALCWPTRTRRRVWLRTARRRPMQLGGGCLDYHYKKSAPHHSSSGGIKLMRGANLIFQSS